MLCTHFSFLLQTEGRVKIIYRAINSMFFARAYVVFALENYCKPHIKSRKTEEHAVKLFSRKGFQPFKIRHHVPFPMQ